VNYNICPKNHISETHIHLQIFVLTYTNNSFYLLSCGYITPVIDIVSFLEAENVHK